MKADRAGKGGRSRPTHTYRREDRIRKKAEFDRVFRRGARKAGKLLTVLATRSSLGRPRLGVCAGKRYGKAVRRNRFKRLVREAFRSRSAELPPMDIVVLARRGADGASDEITRELVSLAGKLGAGR